MRCGVIIVFALLVLFASRPVLAAGLPQGFSAGTVAAAFYDRRFDELESWATEIRTGNLATPDGASLLADFYAGFGQASKLCKLDAACWDVLLTRLSDWQARSPDSPTPFIAEAELLLTWIAADREAAVAEWRAAEGREETADQVQALLAKLAAAERFAGQDPHWHMVHAQARLMAGLSKEGYVDLIRAGWQAFPDFASFYVEGVNGLLPGWGGTAEDIETFANLAASIRPEEGDLRYAWVYITAFRNHYKRNLFTETLVNWPRVLNGMGEIIKAYPSQLNVNVFAHFACLKRDARRTYRFMSMIEKPPVRDVWNDKANYDACDRWALMMGRPSVPGGSDM